MQETEQGKRAVWDHGLWRPAILWGLVALTVATLALAVWFWSGARRRQPAQARPGVLVSQSTAPDFTLAALTGDHVSLSDYRGRVVLLNFWATWCPPCRDEMPDLNAIYRRHGEERNLIVLGIDLEEKPAAIQAFMQRVRVDFPILLDQDGGVTGKTFMVRSLPTSMIIDREGRIRDAWTGRLSQREILARLEQVW